VRLRSHKTPLRDVNGNISVVESRNAPELDQCGAFHTLANGLSLDDNAFALDAFREIGPGKHYLCAAHTLANHTIAFYDFMLADNNSFEQWSAEGAHDQLWRANRRRKELFTDFVAPPLETSIDEALIAYMARRRASNPA